MGTYRIILSVNTNLRKLRTLNESDGNSENELLEIETDEYEGKGSPDSGVLSSESGLTMIVSHDFPVYP